MQVDLLLPDTAATEALGVALARCLDAPTRGVAVVYLRGDLGAGKTTCVRSLLRALGVLGPIRSPTYTLVETYPLSRMTGVHVDLYRVGGPTEVDELGLRDFLGTDCLLLVEWPERAAGVLPPFDLDLEFAYAADGRRCSLLAAAARGEEWLAKLAHDTSLTPYVSHLN